MEKRRTGNEEGSYELPSEVKMVMIGGGGVGKSSMTIRFMTNQFIEDYDSTIEDSYRKQIDIDGKDCVLDILDTAGEEEFSCMLDQWIRDSDYFFLCFSITSLGSFEDEIPIKLEQIRRIKDDCRHFVMLVGNKSDLDSQREVSTELAEQFADEEGLPYVEVSALTGEGIDDMYYNILRFATQNEYPQPPVLTRNIKRAQ